MTITLNGTTGVVAPEFDGPLDASNLTGALPAIDGSALTGIDTTPTTTQVLTATAGASVGSVGSYAFLRKTSSGTAASAGVTFAGSAMQYTDSERYAGAVVGVGTWMCLAHQAFWDRGTVWLRIA